MRVRRLAPLFDNPNDAEYPASRVGPLQQSVAGTDFDAWESSNWATLGLRHDHYSEIYTEFDHHKDEGVHTSVTGTSAETLLGFRAVCAFVCIYSALGAKVGHGLRTFSCIPGDGMLTLSRASTTAAIVAMDEGTT
jgi:hypothetical protein